jgi:peptidoglycan/LPS O-acetylase OafA/YrhL
MTYRPDIDGLRAVAVLVVVLFHLNIPLFSGGYIGVDVFYVISGFLITSIIESKCSQKNFSFSGFYLRRVRRLMPALVVTIVATYVGAAMLFSPVDLIGVARSAVAAQLSLSNILFFSEAGYWDSASELKPLLHTWSLGVEEQFYLFWPALVVFLAAANRRRHLGLSMLLLALGGTALTIWYTGKNQSGAFYLLPFRVNQFALGALVIYAARTRAYQRLQQREWVRLGLGLLGLVLVVYSAIAFDGDTVFPGWAVLTPTLGAVFLLLSGSGGSQVPPLELLLANRVSIWLGKVSYSMYLVHWPVISLYRYDQGLHLTWLEQLGLGLVTLLLTVVMHRLVETRFYSRQHSPGVSEGRTDAQFVRRLGLIMILCTVAPLTAWLGDGWSWRYPSLELTPNQINAGKKARFYNVRKACRIDFPSEHAACIS